MSIKKSPAGRKTAQPRTRRSPEAARENILAAAEALLVKSGPQALKLADVAAGAGVANATVLHHFTSIDGVQTALMERMIEQLVLRILAIPPETAFSPNSGAGPDGLRALFDSFEARGAARLAAWLELTGEWRRLTGVRKAVQEVVARNARLLNVSAEAMEELVLVSVAVAMGVGLFGRPLATLLGKPPGRTRTLAEELLMMKALTLMTP